MAEISTKTKVATVEGPVYDKTKEKQAIEVLKTEKTEVKKAVAVVDKFINRPEDVYLRDETHEDWEVRNILRLKSVGFDIGKGFDTDPEISCYHGYVNDINIFQPNVSVNVNKRMPFIKNEGWDQYNAEFVLVDAAYNELIDRLKVVCGTALFSAEKEMVWLR